MLATGAVLAFVSVALVLWSAATGEDQDFYDIGREGALILGLALTAFALAVFSAGAVLGRVTRLVICARRARARRRPDATV